MGNSKLVDINGLSRYHENLKGVLDTKQDVIADLADIRSGAAKGATALQEVPAEYVTETELEGKGFATTAQVNEKQDIIADLDTIRSGAAAGATALQEVPAEYVTETELEGKGYATTTQVNAKQDIIADLADIRSGAAKGATALQEVPAEYVTETELEGKGFATTAQVNEKQDIIEDLATIRSGATAGATALADAKSYADGLNSAMDARVVVLEAIDHEKLASDASAAAVATVLDGAPEKFDTLKEIAQWIANSESADSAADLVTRVGALEAIDHNAYVAADATTLASAKSYADSLAPNYDAAGAAAQALTDAKEYADGLASNYDAAGAAAQALADAKSYVDGKGYLTENDLVFATNDDIDGLFV